MGGGIPQQATRCMTTLICLTLSLACLVRAAWQHNCGDQVNAAMWTAAGAGRAAAAWMSR